MLIINLHSVSLSVILLIMFIISHFNYKLFMPLYTFFQGHKEWLTEVNVLGIVDHPNLVKLIGYCAEDDERGMQRLLIYEFMPNRSVHDHLSTRSTTHIPWARRLRIALDAARGLTYLHEEMDFQVIGFQLNWFWNYLCWLIMCFIE